MVTYEKRKKPNKHPAGRTKLIHVSVLLIILPLVVILPFAHYQHCDTYSITHRRLETSELSHSILFMSGHGMPMLTVDYFCPNTDGPIIWVISAKSSTPIAEAFRDFPDFRYRMK